MSDETRSRAMASSDANDMAEARHAPILRRRTLLERVSYARERESAASIGTRLALDQALDDLVETVNDLWDALSWYADEENGDRGERARAALAKAAAR